MSVFYSGLTVVCGNNAALELAPIKFRFALLNRELFIFMRRQTVTVTNILNEYFSSWILFDLDLIVF